MLIRHLLQDNTLKNYGIIILDEAHERSINTDILFALLKKLIQKRSNLRLIITSATIDFTRLKKYFLDCPIFKIPGRSFPVQILYAKEF